MVDTKNSAPIVVGIDGSAASLAALRWALREGLARSLPVEVVHSWEPRTLTDAFFGTPHELHTASQSMLQNEVSAALARMPEAPEVTRTSLRGRPSTVLLDRAAHATELVLGIHGGTSLADIIFGQVAAACLTEAKCPVVIVDAAHHAVRHESGDRRVVAS